jgi:hypothetical protein
MDIGPSLVTDRQAAIAMEPGEGPFDDPPRGAEPAAVRRSTSREDRDDALCEQFVAVGLRIIAAVALQGAGSAAWPAASAAHRGQGCDEWAQLRDVVDVGGG